MFSSLVLPSALPKGQFESVIGTAYSDPFSNVVFLGETSSLSRSATLELLAEGTFPSQALPGFLHEATHHRCFDSPVGYAMLGIEGMSRASWWQTMECRKPGKQCAENQICFNRALVRELFSLISPLAEGLALYGELDASPGSSPAVSKMLSNAALVFFEKQLLKRKRSEAQEWFDEFAHWLSQERRQGGVFEPTRALLGSDSAAEWKRPYVLGYAWVKDLISALHWHSDAAAKDKDASLAFLCSFFFDDWELTHKIVASSWSLLQGKPTQTTRDICDHIRSRVDQIRHPRVARFYEEYVRALANNIDIRTCSFLNYSPRYSMWIPMLGASGSVSEMNWRAPKASGFRHAFRFGVMSPDEMTLKLESGCVRCVFDDLAFEVQFLPDGVPDSAQEGDVTAKDMDASVEFILVQNRVLILFFFKHSLVATTDRRLQPIPTQLAEKMLGEIPSFFHNEGWRLHQWELLNPSPETPCAAYLAHRLSEAERLTGKIYKHGDRMTIQPEQVSAWFKKKLAQARHGLLNLLKRSPAPPVE